MSLSAAPEWSQVLDRRDASVHKHLLCCWSTACLLDNYGVGNGARETGENVFSRRMYCLSLKSDCALPIFFQLAVESGLTDAEQLRSHQLVPV